MAVAIDQTLSCALPSPLCWLPTARRWWDDETMVRSSAGRALWREPVLPQEGQSPDRPHNPTERGPNMGKYSARKGRRYEYEVRDWLRSMGLAAARVPLSGAAGGRWAGDLVCDGLGIIECKRVKQLPALLRNALLRSEVVLLREDRGEHVLVLCGEAAEHVLRTLARGANVGN